VVLPEFNRAAPGASRAGAGLASWVHFCGGGCLGTVVPGRFGFCGQGWSNTLVKGTRRPLAVLKFRFYQGSAAPFRFR